MTIEVEIKNKDLVRSIEVIYKDYFDQESEAYLLANRVTVPAGEVGTFYVHSMRDLIIKEV